jgi:2,4-dienoyl-CoA reductase [(3E)-enoyl-CoA-producing], mitochondrial
MFKNKKILITGASSGLGKALAIAYAREKGKIINLSRNQNKINILNEKLKKINNTDNIGYSVDVSNYDEIFKVKNNLLRENNLPDIIINNAAGNFLCPFEDLTPNGWKRINDIVLTGAFNIYHIFGKTFIEKKREAIFLNISTTYSENSSALVIPSAVAKAGVDNIMKGLTVEWSKYGMRFVGIAPGPIANSGGASKLDPFGIFKYYNNYVNPSQRMCDPSEIADLSLFLTSKKANYINGEIIRIDGGEYIKNQGEFSFLTNIPFYKKLFKK